MSKLYDVLCQVKTENMQVPRSNADSQLNEGGRHRLDLGESALEETVKFVQRVFVIPNSHAPRVVVFSSVDQPNSSNELCSRAGQVLATLVSESVCLVDANLRMPSLHRLLGLGNSPGLLDAAARPGPIKDLAVRIADGNLWLVPAGAPATQVEEPVASDRLRSQISELEKEFDYILIDAPPIHSSADAVLLGQMAEGVILVVEANSTRREAARRAMQTLERANVKLLGVILNNRTFPIPEALYRRL
jgi:Mrp family chromosome partitioning ATPase